MRILTFLFIFLSVACQAQRQVTGMIIDVKTKQPLPFATIMPQNGKVITADIDGRFSFAAEEKTNSFTVSYTGYGAQTVFIATAKKYYSIKLSQKTEELSPIVIDAKNPAREVIRQAILRKELTDPQQKLSSFQYKNYTRLLVTANPDSITGKLDSIYLYEKIGKRFERIDSSDFKFKKLIETQHLYQTEKVSEFKFNRDTGLKEVVMATRMAGFKQPVYEIIGLKLQSYSVYTKNIDLFETKYEGPLSDGALSEYSYKILDTLSIDNRRVYKIFFSPKRKNKNKKLEGILYIDTTNYGVAQALFRVKNVLDISATHYFKFEKDLGLWFPDKRSLVITKGNNKEDIKILGEVIKFDAVNKKDKSRDKEASDFIYLQSESVNFEKQFNVPVKIRRPDVAIEVRQEAINRPEEYWNRFRTDTLDSRSIKTYIALDSLISKENWEQRLILGRNIINGYIPAGAIDLDLRHLLKFNNYEGFRVGVGGITNDKFAETFRISGYTAYGTKDGEFKYNLGAAMRIGKFSNSWIGVSYTDDIKEIGSTTFAVDKRVFKIYDPRPINLTTFYNHQTYQAHIETKIIPRTESTWQLTRSRIDPKFGYTFQPVGQGTYSVFNITTATASIQWNPYSDYMQTPGGRIEVEKRFPKFTFQYMQSISGVLGSEFTFGKLDFRAEYEKKYLNGQKTSLLLQSGLALGDTPLTHLYSTSPNSLDKDAILQRVTFAGKNSFETMYFNEFFSSQYVIVQLKHAFRKFTVIDKVKLSPVLVHRAAWGNMEYREEHIGLDYNTLEKGYYESGLELNEIFMGLGISAFYRYGPYNLPEFDRNISIKMSFMLNLGI